MIVQDRTPVKRERERNKKISHGDVTNDHEMAKERHRIHCFCSFYNGRFRRHRQQAIKYPKESLEYLETTIPH